MYVLSRIIIDPAGNYDNIIGFKIKNPFHQIKFKFNKICMLF